MANNQNTDAMRKREMNKKLKTEENRARRNKCKEAAGYGAGLDAPAAEPEMHGEANKATTHEEQTDPFRKDVNNE